MLDPRGCRIVVVVDNDQLGAEPRGRPSQVGPKRVAVETNLFRVRLTRKMDLSHGQFRR